MSDIDKFLDELEGQFSEEPSTPSVESKPVVSDFTPESVPTQPALIPTPGGQRARGESPEQLGQRVAAGDPSDPSRLHKPGTHPDSPLPGANTEISQIDQTKLAFGNPRGQVGFLKSQRKKGSKDKRFQDVKINTQGDLVYQKDGVWKPVNPSQFKNEDGWSISERIKETIKDAKTFTATSIAPTVGGIVGLGAGPIVGTTVGTLAGIQANQAMGRVFGTYDATPEEIATDLAMDTVMMLTLTGLGQGVSKLRGSGSSKQVWAPKSAESVGQRPNEEGLLGMVKNLGRGINDRVKNSVIKPMLRITGVDDTAADQALNSPTVEKELRKILHVGGAGPSKVLEANTRKNVQAMKTLYDRSRSNLTKRFLEKQNTLLSHPDINKVSINTGELTKDLMQELVELGVVKAQPRNAFSTGYEMVPLKDLNPIIGEGFFKSGAYRRAQELVTAVNKYSVHHNGRQAKGLKAAKEALKLRRGLNKLTFAMRNDEGLSTHIGAAGRRTMKSFDDAFSVTPELAARHQAMNNFYSSNVGAVQEAARIAKHGRPGDPTESITSQMRKIFKKEQGNNAHVVFERMLALGTETDRAIWNSIKDRHAAEQFRRVFPLSATGLAGKLLFPVQVAATATGATSPRIAGTTVMRMMSGARHPVRSSIPAQQQLIDQLPFMKEFRNSIFSLDPENRQRLLKDPDLLIEMSNTVDQAKQIKEETVEGLLEDAGKIIAGE